MRNRYLLWLSRLLLVVLGLTGGLAAQSGISFIEPLATSLTFPNGGDAIGIARGDFDGDGNLDLALTQITNVPGVGQRGFVSILLGNGNGTFRAPNNIPVDPPGGFARGILAKDFDGDGRLDLVVDVSEQLQGALLQRPRQRYL